MTRSARNAKGDLLEPAFQAQVIGLLRVYRWSLIYHAPDGGHAPGASGRRVAGGQIPEGRGFPDLLAVKGERLLVAELKTNTGRLRPGQQDWLHGFHRAGAEAYLWKPAQWDEIHDIIRGTAERRRDLDPL